MPTIPPDDATVVEAVHATFRELYGQDIVTVLMWLPPGETTLQFVSNGDPSAIVRALREAADNMEHGPVRKHVIKQSQSS